VSAFFIWVWKADYVYRHLLFTIRSMPPGQVYAFLSVGQSISEWGSYIISSSLYDSFKTAVRRCKPPPLSGLEYRGFAEVVLHRFLKQCFADLRSINPHADKEGKYERSSFYIAY
jgi:hypothetical protein